MTCAEISPWCIGQMALMAVWSKALAKIARYLANPGPCMLESCQRIRLDGFSAGYYSLRHLSQLANHDLAAIL